MLDYEWMTEKDGKGVTHLRDIMNKYNIKELEEKQVMKEF